MCCARYASTGLYFEGVRTKNTLLVAKQQSVVSFSEVIFILKDIFVHTQPLLQIVLHKKLVDFFTKGWGCIIHLLKKK